MRLPKIEGNKHLSHLDFASLEADFVEITRKVDSRRSSSPKALGTSGSSNPLRIRGQGQ